MEKSHALIYLWKGLISCYQIFAPISARVRSIIPTAHNSDSPLLRQPITPTAHYSDNPLFRQPIVPTAH